MDWEKIGDRSVKNDGKSEKGLGYLKEHEYLFDRAHTYKTSTFMVDGVKGVYTLKHLEGFDYELTWSPN